MAGDEPDATVCAEGPMEQDLAGRGEGRMVVSALGDRTEPIAVGGCEGIWKKS